MKAEYLEKLLEMYKKAIANNVSAIDFTKEILDAKIELDKSFIKTGKEDMNLGEYLQELYELQEKTQER